MALGGPYVIYQWIVISVNKPCSILQSENYLHPIQNTTECEASAQYLDTQKRHRASNITPSIMHLQLHVHVHVHVHTYLQCTCLQLTLGKEIIDLCTTNGGGHAYVPSPHHHFRCHLTQEELQSLNVHTITLFIQMNNYLKCNCMIQMLRERS